MDVLKAALMRPVDHVLLLAQKRLTVAYDALAPMDPARLAAALQPRREWDRLSAELKGVFSRSGQPLRPQGGSLNDGDRRALYHLIRELAPRNVLEIGTHVGSSTIHIAAALRENAGPNTPGRVTTVDIVDVNGPDGPWSRSQLERSPAQMAQAIGMGEHVRFCVSDSISFLEGCEETFDFIFLDGSHRAKDVYAEVQMVQRCAGAGATILLHDFFPGGRPLWPGSKPLTGPWLAYSRLRREGAPLAVLPLGALPWPTKKGSNLTSLALLGRVVPAGAASGGGLNA